MTVEPNLHLRRGGLGCGVLRHFQQYFSYIVVDETGIPGEKHRPVASHRQT